MDNFYKKYCLCKFCESVEEIDKQHSNLPLLKYLVTNAGIDLLENNLFKKIQETLVFMQPSLNRMRHTKRNKIVSKYYLYILKHRNFMVSTSEVPSPTYSPMKREDVFQEYHEILNVLLKTQ